MAGIFISRSSKQIRSDFYNEFGGGDGLIRSAASKTITMGEIINSIFFWKKIGK